MAFGNGVFVSVGAGVRISTDGTNWVQAMDPTDDYFVACTFGAGKFAAITQPGSIWTSDDAIDWTERFSSTNVLLRSITYGDGKFVAAGQGVVVGSNNGSDWERIATPPAANVTDIAFGNGIFVGAGYAGDNYRSLDGVNWERSPSDLSSGNKQVAFGNGVFVQCSSGFIYVSKDGTKWTPAYHPSNELYPSVCFGNGMFVASTGNLISANGTNWINVERSGGSGISYANGLFFGIQQPPSTFRISADALHWTDIVGSGADYRVVTYANEAFVTLGVDTARSIDGSMWDLGNSQAPAVTSVAYGNGIYLALRAALSLSSKQPSTSDDGMHWVQSTSTSPAPSGPMAFGNGWFVSAETGFSQSRTPLRRTMDGTNWFDAVAPPEHMSGIGFGDGRFVAVGWEGTVLTSSDAISWATNNVGTNAQLTGVSHANGLFIASAASGGVCFTSSNGLDWTSHPAGPDGVPGGNGIVYCNGTFVSPAISSMPMPRLLFSTNGADWSAAQGYQVNRITALASDGLSAVAVADRNVLQSEPFSPTPPSIGKQPAANEAVSDGSVIFEVAACGSLPLSYQWFKGGSSLPGETRTHLLIRNVQPSNLGDYRVVVTNPFGVVTSSVAGLSISTGPASPIITSQPTNKEAEIGQTIYFAVAASGGSGLSYQWSKDGTEIPDATNSVLVFRIVSETDAGEYVVEVKNRSGAVTSDAAALGVSLPVSPVILFGPQDQIVTNGDTATFSVTAVSATLLSYQWYRNSNPMANETNSTMVVSNNFAGSFQFRVDVANASGAASATARLYVYSAPQIGTQPVGVNIAARIPLRLEATALGNVLPEPSVQWFKDGQPIPGATQFIYSNPAPEVSDSGTYHVELQNLISTAVSEPAQVNVFPESPLDHWKPTEGFGDLFGFNHLVYAGGRFTAIGTFWTAISTNGREWSELDTAGAGTASLTDLAYGNGRFVIVGNQSTFGFTYQDEPNAFVFNSVPSVGDLGTIVFGNGVFAAAGTLGIATSQNGADWLIQTNLTSMVSDVAFGSGRFVAVTGNRIYESSNAIHWTQVPLPDPAFGAYVGVAFGEGVFVAVTSSGRIDFSRDGLVWTITDLDKNYARQLAGVTYGEGVFVAYGNGNVFSSIDGITWVRHHAGANPPQESAPAFPNVVAIGNGNAIQLLTSTEVLASEPMLRLEARSSDKRELRIWGMSGERCRIESKNSFSAIESWSPVTSLVIEAYPTAWRELDWTIGTQRFYRAVIAPLE